MAKAVSETRKKGGKSGRAKARPAPDGTAERAVSLSASKGIATLTIDLPGRPVNLLTPAVMSELDGAIRELAGRGDLRCLVIRSGKPGVFIAGADINEIAALKDPVEAERKSEGGQEIFNRIEDLPFATLAVIDGACLGGGLELSLACDYRIATDNPKTRIGLPETGLGIIPGFGGTYRLPKVVGLSQALAMILAGSPVDGAKAAKIGLVDACYPAAFIEEKTKEFVEQILDAEGAEGAAAIRRRRRQRPPGIGLLEGNPIGRALLFGRARKEANRRTGGHYPAQAEALKVLKRSVTSRRATALRMERAAFARLAPTPVSKNLLDLFFAREAAKRPPAETASKQAARGRGFAARDRADGSANGRKGARPGMPVPGRGIAALREGVRRAAILGAGVMGGKIAWLFSRSDIPVVMKDIAWSAVQGGYASALSIYREQERRRRLDRRQINLKMHHLTGTLDYDSLMNPDFVIEAVVEKLDVKKRVLAEVEEHVGSHTVIASNTSSLSIEAMALSLKKPERFLGMHFFNPPDRMPLVEIIPGAKTDPQAVRTAFELALTVGKTPVVVKDCPGFLVNRLLLPYLNEAALMACEGVDYLRIDRLIELFGMPMGPFTLFDEIGIDVAIEVAGVLQRAYGDRLIPVPLFDGLSKRKDLLGRKSGKGFYLYRDGRKLKPNPEMAAFVKAARGGRRSRISDRDLVHRPVLALLNEAARALEEGVVRTGSELDLALILGTGFPPFRGGILKYADSLGLADVKSRLERFAADYGKRFEPAHLIADLAPTKRRISAYGREAAAGAAVASPRASTNEAAIRA